VCWALTRLQLGLQPRHTSDVATDSWKQSWTNWRWIQDGSLRDRRQLRYATGSIFSGMFPRNSPNLFTVYCNMRSSPHGNFMATIATSSQILVFTGISYIIYPSPWMSMDVHGCPWPKIYQLPSTKITKARENHTSAALPFRPPASCRPKRASELAADGRRIPWSVCLTTKSGEIQEKMRKLAANSTSNCILVLYHSRSVEFVGDSLDLNVRGIGVQSAAPAVNHV